jgi:Family of unknown function (DUF6328)
MRPPGYSDERHAMADDRQLRELQRELRAVGLGALVLLGFLCNISFRSRFAGISDVQRGMYVTSVVLTALAAALLLAPAAYVRLAPGHGRRSRFPARCTAWQPAAWPRRVLRWPRRCGWRPGGPNPAWQPTFSARVRQRCSLPPGLSCPGC